MFINMNIITKLLVLLQLINRTLTDNDNSDRTINLGDCQYLINYNITEYRYKAIPSQNCLCNVSDPMKCIRKCCAIGFKATKGRCIRDENFNNSTTFTIPIYKNKTFVNNLSINNSNLIIGVMDCDFFPLSPLINPTKDHFLLQEDGRLWTFLYDYLDNQHYCIDNLDNYGLSAFVCWKYQTDDIISTELNITGMIISMPFLLATFIAYALLPDRNLHMKALMSYVINLMFGYLLLVIIQLTKTQFSVASCKSLGYFCLFFFMVSFFWMNVICIDIWFGFSGYRGFSGSKSAERKRFLLYCAYAWGMSILHILTVLLIDSISNPSSWYAPGIGNGQCFIKTGWAELLYFYGPMGILITINVTLFVITAFKIRSLKKDTAMLKKDDSKRHSYENDKQKFNLYVKLLFAMGVNWSMEIISWAVIWNYKDVSTYIWYLTDFCNAAYGVFIFFIFVFKKNIWKLLQKRYYSFIGKPHLAHSVGQTQTRTTSYSTANTSLHETTSHHPNGGGGSHITETSVLTTEA